MSLKAIVSERAVTVAIVTGAVTSLLVLSLYVRGLPFSVLSYEFANVPIVIAEAVVAWYAFGMARHVPHAFLPLLPWIPLFKQIANKAATIVGQETFVRIELPVWFFGEAVYLVLLLSAIRAASGVPSGADASQPSLEPSVTTVPSTPDSPREGSAAVVIVDADLSVHSRVTESVRLRSAKMSDTARLSMVMMILLVLVGGGASVGLWFAGQLDRVRTLEVERNRLVQLTSNLDRLSRETAVQQSETVGQIRKFIQENYNQAPTYQTLLRDIADRTQTSWPDIAIRATIAILTLFVVQIFFAVYKYSQHLSNQLAAKAEALELIGASAEDRQNLRREIVALAKEATPNFGTSPATPLQELLDILDKLKKSKAD